jgi:hypothetical protein
MGIRNTDVKAGDLFEWHYVCNDDDELALDDEEIGTYEDVNINDFACRFQWFPIGKICLMIMITTDRYFWISKNRVCYCYHSDDYLKCANTPFLAIQTLE